MKEARKGKGREEKQGSKVKRSGCGREEKRSR